MTFDASITIVGAGVVGLAIAARLAPRHPNLVILERERKYGMGVSSRNSEVIHAGLYYQTGSLKAQLCVEGNRLMYELCHSAGIPHRRIGKLITAADDSELAALAKIDEHARANGVGVTRLSKGEIKELEPHIDVVAALWSPTSGLVSVHDLMDFLFSRARDAGATYAAGTEVLGIEALSAGYRVAVRSGGELSHITTERVINAAGLEGDTIAALAGIDVDAAGYRLFYSRGSYFVVPRSLWSLVNHLVYPASEPFGCPHTAQDLDGRLRFGPDTVSLPDRTLDYSVDDSRRSAVGRVVRKFLPQIRDDDLQPDLAGISPRLRRAGELLRTFRDYVIQDEKERGLPGFINVIGIDSPGLTASLAIAARVESMIA